MLIGQIVANLSQKKWCKCFMRIYRPGNNHRSLGLNVFLSRWCSFSKGGISVIVPWRVYLGLSPLPVTVTTRIFTFLVGNPYKPSFPLLLGRGTTQGISISVCCKVRCNMWIVDQDNLDPPMGFVFSQALRIPGWTLQWRGEWTCFSQGCTVYRFSK